MPSAGLPQELTVGPHNYAIILTDSLSLLQKMKKMEREPRLECVHGRHSDWHVSMVDIHLRKLLRVYCLGHAAVTRNDQADRLAGKATLTSVLLLGISEVLRSLRHHLRTQSQEHHTIDRLKERGVKRGG